MKHLLFVASLIQAAGLGQSGVDLFVGTIPADVLRGVMLRDPLTGHTIEQGSPGFYASEFQIVVRDPDAIAGYNRAQAISDAITINRVETAELVVNWISPFTKPVSYPRGDADDIETAVRFRIGFGEK